MDTQEAEMVDYFGLHISLTKVVNSSDVNRGELVSIETFCEYFLLAIVFGHNSRVSVHYPDQPMVVFM